MRSYMFYQLLRTSNLYSLLTEKLCLELIGSVNFFLLRNKKDIPNFFLKSSTTRFKKRLKNQIHFKDYSDRELNMNLLKFDKIYITDQLIIDFVKNKISRNYFDKYLSLRD